MSSRLLQVLVLFGIVFLMVLGTIGPAAADENDAEADTSGEVEDGGDADGEVEEEEEYDEDEEPDIESMTVNGQTIQFGIPDEDDDFHAMHIPDEFRCEACKILAKQFQTAFDKANEKRPSLKKNLPESDIIDILEEECESEFMQVGVKEVNGVKRLSGPGMPSQDAPGLMAGGGKWPIRMRSLCGDIVGEVEEDEIYRLYKDGKLESHLCIVKYPSSNCVTVDKSSGMRRVEL